MLPLHLRILQFVLMRLRPAWLAAKVKNLIHVQRVTIDTEDGRFWVDPVSLLGMALSTHGRHEPSMGQTLGTLLKPGMTFVDLGANEGYFSVLAGRLVGLGGRVLAIEPQDRLQPIISRNLELNTLANVQIAHVLVCDHTGVESLHLMPSTATGGSGVHRRTSYELPTQEVPAITLEALLDHHEIRQVDLMKVDIEGSEYEAILGSPALFRSGRIKAMALELHPAILAERNKRMADITDFLSSCGYTVDRAFGNPVWHFSAA